MLTRLRLRLGTRDAGVTLIETVVATALTSVIGGLALVWFLGGSQANSQTISQNITTAGARNALQQWSYLIGLSATTTNASGTPTSGITGIGPASIAFTAYTSTVASPASCPSTGPCTTLATSSVGLSAASTTRNGVTTLRLAQTSAAGSDTLVPAGVVLPTVDARGCQLFRPYDASGNELTCTSPAQTVLDSIARVDIAFTVTGSKGATSSFMTSASVGGGNR